MTNTTIDVTVIGGYLGAGKTTLVNHLLRTATQRLAVLVNDFGDIAIDADLVVDHDGTTMTLANGCICCSVSDGFVDTLDAVLELDKAPERILIECSGVADPATVAAHAHRPGLRLDGVVVAADAVGVQDRASDRYVGDTVLAQLRSADVILATKADLADRQRLADAVAWITTVAGATPVIPVEGGSVAADLVTGIADPLRARATVPDHLPPDFASASWPVTRPIDLQRLLTALADLPAGVVRAKGVVHVPDRGWVAVHRVGQRLTHHDLGHTPSAGGLVALGHRDALPDQSWIDAF